MKKTSKLIMCKHCGYEIASSAKIFPQCGGKVKKPFYKKVWFWILVGLILAAGSGNSSKTSNDDGKKQYIHSIS